MNIEAYIPNQALLREYIADGTVTARFHKTLPLTILCYGRKATYEDIWDEVTCKTRGLIVDDKGEIVARPFEKFFNANHIGRPETALEELLKEPSPPFFSEKLDGSMGTLYSYNGYSAIASKGSFHSEHAEWASKWYHWFTRTTRSAQSLGPVWPIDYTPVFEMICQEVQHHVVHYEKDRLILIGLVNNRSGEELSHGALKMYGDLNGIEVVKRHKSIDLHTALQEDRPNAEGYVATWYRNGAPPLKVKIKHETFLKLQRLRNGTTPKYIWRLLAGEEGQIGDYYYALGAADPFLKSQILEWTKAYQTAYYTYLADAARIMKLALTTCDTRKEFAEVFMREENRKLASTCFRMLDQEDHQPAIWKLVYPEVAKQRYTPEEE